MDGQLAEETKPLRLETDDSGKVTNFDDFVADLKGIAAKEGIDLQDLEEKVAAQVKAKNEQQPGQLSQEEQWRIASMNQIAAKRMMEHTIMVTDLAKSLFELARLIPGSLPKHRQVATDKAVMLVETFVASIPDPRQQQ